MMRIFLSLILYFLAVRVSSQALLNGDFEDNSAFSDQINLTNPNFNSFMNNCNAFGFYGNLDIISSATYCSTEPESGDWYIAFTGGGSDALAIKINQPLTQGNSYTVSFNDRFCNFGGYVNHAFIFGLSEVQDSFGIEIFHASKPIENE